MHRTKIRKTEHLAFMTDPDLRATIEAEAARRDASVSHTIRSLIRTALSASRQSSPMAEAR
jgi:hypothetical protein